MSGGREWTTGEVKRLYELRAKRTKTAEIAAELGRTQDAIFAYLRYVPATRTAPATIKPTDRLPPREQPPGRSDYWSLDEVRNLRSLAEEGLSIKECGEALGRSFSAVRSKASMLSIRFSRKYISASCRLEQETLHYQRDAVSGSIALRDAIFAAFA